MTRRHHHRPARPTRPTHEGSASAASAMLSVFDGRQCIGHVVGRGRAGFEAYDADQRSLGVFASQRAAVDAINESALRDGEAARQGRAA